MYGNVEGSNYWMIKTFLISYFIHFYFYSESMTAVMFMEGHVRGQWGKVSCMEGQASNVRVCYCGRKIYEVVS